MGMRDAEQNEQSHEPGKEEPDYGDFCSSNVVSMLNVVGIH